MTPFWHQTNDGRSRQALRVPSAWRAGSQAERDEFKGLLSAGKHAARKLKRAQILLAADVGAGDYDIATSVGVGCSTVYRTKQRFVLDSLEAGAARSTSP